MKPSNVSASSGGSASCASLLSAVLLSLCLTACKPKDVRPSSVPEVRCLQPRTGGIADWPADWLADGPGYTLGIIGQLTEEWRLAAIEAECVEKLREQGVIR